jgi:hypothetical protein
MYQNSQFILQERTSNPDGIIFMDKNHYPIYFNDLLRVPNLSPIINYSLICQQQKTYELSPNTSVYFLILHDC